MATYAELQAIWEARKAQEAWRREVDGLLAHRERILADTLNQNFPQPDYTAENLLDIPDDFKIGGTDPDDLLPDMLDGAGERGTPPEPVRPWDEDSAVSRALGRAIGRSWDDDSLAELRLFGSGSCPR